jgi:hypothetical protein
MDIHHGKILSVLLLIGSFGALVEPSIAVPTPAQAEPRQIQLLLNSQGNQNFEALIRQAESVAQNYIQQAFAESLEVTEVSVTIVGEHNGATVPLLSSTVSRSNWQAKPTVQAWTRYFGSAEVLLGFTAPQQPDSVAASASFDPVAASKLDREPNFYN